MKIIIYENPEWRFLPDSAYSNAGKPFYIPDFADNFEAFMAPTIKITRLGKSIATKFASRYYLEIAPAIHFRSPSHMESLRNDGRPDDAGCSFDRSVIVGEMEELATIDKDSGFTMSVNGNQAAKIAFSRVIEMADEAISKVSSCNTIKMGDLLIPIMSEGISIKIGDRLEVEAPTGRRLLAAVK